MDNQISSTQEGMNTYLSSNNDNMTASEMTDMFKGFTNVNKIMEYEPTKYFAYIQKQRIKMEKQSGQNYDPEDFFNKNLYNKSMVDSYLDQKKYEAKWQKDLKAQQRESEDRLFKEYKGKLSDDEIRATATLDVACKNNPDLAKAGFSAVRFAANPAGFLTGKLIGKTLKTFMATEAGQNLLSGIKGKYDNACKNPMLKPMLKGAVIGAAVVGATLLVVGGMEVDDVKDIGETLIDNVVEGDQQGLNVSTETPSADLNGVANETTAELKAIISPEGVVNDEELANLKMQELVASESDKLTETPEVETPEACNTPKTQEQLMADAHKANAAGLEAQDMGETFDDISEDFSDGIDKVADYVGDKIDTMKEGFEVITDKIADAFPINDPDDLTTSAQTPEVKAETPDVETAARTPDQIMADAHKANTEGLETKAFSEIASDMADDISDGFDVVSDYVEEKFDDAVAFAKTVDNPFDGVIDNTMEAVAGMDLNPFDDNGEVGCDTPMSNPFEGSMDKAGEMIGEAYDSTKEAFNNLSPEAKQVAAGVTTVGALSGAIYKSEKNREAKALEKEAQANEDSILDELKKETGNTSTNTPTQKQHNTNRNKLS